MSDVVWAAIVAGVVGLLGSMVGSVTAPRVARQAAKHEQQRREEDRLKAAQGERVADYKQFAWLLERVRKYAATGYPQTADDWMDWLDHYYYWRSAILVGGASSVVAASDAMTDQLDASGAVLAQAAEEGRWREAFAAGGDALESARLALLEAMREDAHADPGSLDHRRTRTRPPPGSPPG
jgi:heme exporter protein D